MCTVTISNINFISSHENRDNRSSQVPATLTYYMVAPVLSASGAVSYAVAIAVTTPSQLSCGIQTKGQCRHLTC